MLDLVSGDWKATFDERGVLVRLARGDDEFVAPGASRPVIVEVGGEQYHLDLPHLERVGDQVVARHELDAVRLSVIVANRLLTFRGRGIALEYEVILEPRVPIVTDVAVRLPATVSVKADRELFAPLKNGVGYLGRDAPALGGHFAWELAGGERVFQGGYAVPLGLPLVSEHDEGPWRLTWCADPYFTTAFFLPPGTLQDAPKRELNWRYLGAVGLRAPERRRIYACLHEGEEEAAIEAFYLTALAEVPPGPAWLHDIALIHYDYLADDGRGWYADVDSLAEAIPKEDRFRVCLCLHGWYDRLGSYSMDPSTREIRDSWTLVRGHQLSAQGGLELTRTEVTKKLRYARGKGFRAMLYYGDGLVAGMDFARQQFPAPAILRTGGWEEGIEHSVLLNPLHAEVRRWFLDYTRALVAAFGDNVDGFVWDETFYVQAGELGPANCPGYVDRAFLTLVREITETVHQYRADLAFLCSDDVGITPYFDGTGHRGVAYSLVADGCWQDSACSPEAWPFGLFPNFRNVLWSCNWWPVGNFAATLYGAENFGSPAVTSNGWGENRPISAYPPGAFAAILEVFRMRAVASRRWCWLGPEDPRRPGVVGSHPLPGHIESVT